MKDAILAFNFTVAETDIIINALEERAILINDLKQKIYDSATTQVKNIETARALIQTSEEAQTNELEEEVNEE